MAIIPKTTELENAIQDANDNYLNSRFPNAAFSFNHIALICLKEQYIEDALYFYYRSIVASSKANDIDAMTRTMRKLAIDFLRVSVTLATQSIDKTKDLKKRATMINTAQQNLKNLGEEEGRKPMVESLIQSYVDLAEDPKEREIERENYYEWAIALSEEIGNDPHNIRLQFAVYLENKCDVMQKKLSKNEDDKTESYNNDILRQQLSHELARAAQQYKIARDRDKYLQLVDQALKIYPEINLDKYDLVDRSNFSVI